MDDDGARRGDGDIPGVDPADVARRRAERRREEERRRHARRTRLGVIVGAGALAVAVGAVGLAFVGSDGDGQGAASATSSATTAPAPTTPATRDVSVPRSTTSAVSTTTRARITTRTAFTRSASTTPTVSTRSASTTRRAVPPVDAARGAAAASRPVVWVQAGHAPPGEPGFRAQTGSGSGPFGEVEFNRRVSRLIIRKLRAQGVDARYSPALITPWGARGAAFVSIHHDTPQGSAQLGYAVSDPTRRENYYHGEGTGTASPTPYPDSAPHRDDTTVTPRVESRSRSLANAIGRRFSAVFTPANGARSRYTGVQPRNGNVRMMFFYGYYRTRADARVLVEAGAGGADDRFLVRTDLISTAVTAGIVDHLRERGLVR